MFKYRNIIYITKIILNNMQLNIIEYNYLLQLNNNY